MKCTDNKRRRKRKRRLSKRERRRRALIRLVVRIITLLCLVLIIFGVFRLFAGKNKAAKYESETYNTTYHKESLFASSLSVIGSEENISLKDVSKLKAYGLFDVNNSNALYAHQVYDKIYPASTTKILTALVALENASLSDSVIVSKNACSTTFAWDEQTCGIKEGDTVSLEDLLYGLLLYSGNDAAVAIAEHVGGGVEEFANMMNNKAAELMATHSNFVNPSGLYDDDHYTTAYDLYLIFNECIKNKDFVKIIGADSYTATVTGTDSTQRELTWKPTNYYDAGLVNSPENVNVIGGKTGTLLVAGNCLILMSEDNNSSPYISIVMGAESKDLLYKDMNKLLTQIPDNQASKASE